MNWNTISNPSDIDALLTESNVQPVLLFKHSTRCSISATALARVERKWQEADSSAIKPFYLDLIANRPASNHVADVTGVRHESPQAIVLHKGKVVYQATHTDIRYDDILSSVVTA